MPSVPMPLSSPQAFFDALIVSALVQLIDENWRAAGQRIATAGEVIGGAVGGISVVGRGQKRRSWRLHWDPVGALELCL